MKVNSAFDLLVKTKVDECETAMQDHTLQTWFQNKAKKKKTKLQIKGTVLANKTNH